jgi:hypothetical protein
MRIKLPDGSKRLIPKPPIGYPRRKSERFYNWAEDDDGKPYGAQFSRDVPRDQYHLRLLAKGDVALADDKPAPEPKGKRVKKD